MGVGSISMNDDDFLELHEGPGPLVLPEDKRACTRIALDLASKLVVKWERERERRLDAVFEANLKLTHSLELLERASRRFVEVRAEEAKQDAEEARKLDLADEAIRIASLKLA
jgi:hypothetical protein